MVAAAGYSDPLVDGGPDSQGALIVSITYSLMFIAITLAAARMYSSFHRNNQVGGDDICFYTALVSFFFFVVVYLRRCPPQR